jgi:hypothetical protein
LRTLVSREEAMRRWTYLPSACLTLLATMALARSVPYEYDHAANFSKYKTYGWTRGTDLTDELNHTRIVRAIDAALVAKGLLRVEPSATPDALVAYHASFELERFSGSGSSGLGGSGTMQSVLVGTLVVEISDARTNTIVWRSLARSDLRPYEASDSRGRKFAKAAEKMFKNYPPKPVKAADENAKTSTPTK